MSFAIPSSLNDVLVWFTEKAALLAAVEFFLRPKVYNIVVPEKGPYMPVGLPKSALYVPLVFVAGIFSISELGDIYSRVNSELS
jgi:hypothetical protein